MSNAWWYGAITLLFIVVAIYTFWKVPDKKLVGVYAFLSGLTYAVEYVVLVLFDSYRYRPNVMKDEYFDNIVGAIVSDAISVPIAGVLVAAFQLGWKWMILLSSSIVGIEILFVRLSLYEQYWWKLPYTGIGLVVWFVLAKFCYNQLRTKVTVWLRWVVLFCTNMLIQASLVFVLVAFFHAYHYEIGWFHDKTRDHVAFATAYIFFFSFIFSSLVTFRIKWFWRIVVVLLLTPIDWILKEHGVLHMSTGWSQVHFIVLRILLVAALDLFNRLVLEGKPGGPKLTPD